MSETRRLGKGLEDISHLFLSSQEEQLMSTRRADMDVGKISPQNKRSPHYVCLVGDQPDIDHAFWVFQLSSALAKFGKRILVVDMDEELPCVYFLTGGKPRTDNSIDTHAFIREGPSGVKVVELSETVIAKSFSTRATDRILHDLKHLEEKHDVVLLSVVQETLLRMDGVIPDPLLEFILSVDRDKFKMLSAYKTIKAIFSVHPLAHAGIIITPISHSSEADLVHGKMSGAVEKFLYRELHQYGFLYKREKEPDPVVLSDSSCDADLSSCVSNIAQNLIGRLNLKETSSPGHFFSNLFAGYSRVKRNG